MKFLAKKLCVQRLLAAVLICGAVLLTLPLLPRQALRLAQSESVAVYAQDGSLLRLTLASDQRYRLWVPLAEIPQPLQRAVLLHEDLWFRWHPGVNPISLVRGAMRTYVTGGRRQGGSTLSMQLVRLLTGLRTHDPAGKIVQSARALWLDARYSKDEILEAYLNFAPYGGNVEGVGAASLLYFGKHVQALSLPEMLTLAVLPQSPLRRMDEAQQAGRINRELTAARNRLFARFVAQDATLAQQAPMFELPLALRGLKQRPFAAPHLVEQLLQRAQPRVGAIRSLLQPRLQRILEQQTHAYLARRSRQGLNNASAILVDTRNMAVVALLGSANYRDASIAGQVNGTLARRSPGSTLKPFIYGLALDQGVLHPETVLRDVPTAFGPYAPENFDGAFDGPVTATEALTRSRNIPAVWAAAQLTQPTLYQFLQAAGVRELRSEKHYGLALVLGGGEISMQELATMYAMLRNGGRVQALRWTQAQAVGQQSALLSPEAAYITEQMLRSRARPGQVPGARSTARIAWKTGTSWGFRDAWTAGLVGPYVLVVWLGDFQGAGHPSLIGVDAAAPLFFSIADQLLGEDPAARQEFAKRPESLRRIEVCRASGGLPTRWCTRRVLTWFIPGRSPVRIDQVYRPVRLHRDTGAPLCPGDPAPSISRIFEFWPTELSEVYRAAGMPRKTPPRAEHCSRLADGDGQAPRIASPRRGTIYKLRPGQRELSLRADADADVQTLHWFADEAYLGTTNPGSNLAWSPMRSAAYEVRVVDDHGRSNQRAVEVEIMALQ